MFDLTAGVYFYCYNNIFWLSHTRVYSSIHLKLAAQTIIVRVRRRKEMYCPKTTAAVTIIASLVMLWPFQRNIWKKKPWRCHALFFIFLSLNWPALLVSVGSPFISYHIQYAWQCMAKYPHDTCGVYFRLWVCDRRICTSLG